MTISSENNNVNYFKGIPFRNVSIEKIKDKTLKKY